MQNKSGFIFISEMQPIFERQLKGSVNRAKNQILGQQLLDTYQLNPSIHDVLSKIFACARKQC
jgi:hypothetical protein